MPTDVVQRFHAALPRVRAWIDDYLQRHTGQARSVQTIGVSRLSDYYPGDLLARTRTATVDWVQFPPVHQFGLPEFAALQHMNFDGITFKDTYFMRGGSETPALHFHELVHVVQWARLGVDNFILAYGVGLLQGYQQAPLERMAYQLQADFVRGASIPRLVERIEQETDAIWQQAYVALK